MNISSSEAKQSLYTEPGNWSPFGDDRSVPEVLGALVQQADFNIRTIAEAIGLTDSTFDAWLFGVVREKEPSDIYYKNLSNLRAAMARLIELGLDAETAGVCMQTPIGKNPDNTLLLQISKDPEEVFEAIDIIYGN